MQKTHIWGKFNLYRNKIAFSIFLCFLFFCNLSFGQQGQLYSQENMKWDTHLPNYDNRTLHYGFTLGLNSTRFRPIQSNQFFYDSATSIQSPSMGGFNLGFVTNLRLGRYFDLRLLPGVAFYNRSVRYQFQNGFTSTQSTESVFIETPLLLKYKSQRRKNHRMYVVGGIKPCIEAGAKKKEKKRNELRTENIDFNIEYGFGFDFYFQFFKFAPEIRFSHGLTNMLTRDPNPYSENLLKLTTHTITLYFFFE